MSKYIVRVAVTKMETWHVEADDEIAAMEAAEHHRGDCLNSEITDVTAEDARRQQ